MELLPGEWIDLDATRPKVDRKSYRFGRLASNGIPCVLVSDRSLGSTKSALKKDNDLTNDLNEDLNDNNEDIEATTSEEEKEAENSGTENGTEEYDEDDADDDGYDETEADESEVDHALVDHEHDEREGAKRKCSHEHHHLTHDHPHENADGMVDEVAVVKEEELDNDQDVSGKRTGEDQADASRRKAAIAVCVGVGSYSDPLECQGLAHFLEHLLFMGSEKYPKENYFDQFITKKGGIANAYTAEEETVYYFDINDDGLFKAIDILAQFFIQPKLNPDAIKRELESIQSEFDSALNSDGNRLQSVYNSMAKDDHPFSKFLWGNIESISCHSPDGDLKNSGAYKMLRQFYDRYYGAENISICIISSFTVEEMQFQVEQAFSPVRKCTVDPFTFSQYALSTKQKVPFWDLSFDGKFSRSISDQISGRDTFLKMLRVSPMPNIYPFESIFSVLMIPIKQMHRLTLSFQFPSFRYVYQSKPDDFIAHILGHESTGSLLAVLKDLDLANSTNVGKSQCVECTGFDLFEITVNLTPNGVAVYEQVITLIFAYIELMQTKVKETIKIMTRLNAEKSASNSAKRISELCKLPLILPGDVYCSTKAIDQILSSSATIGEEHSAKQILEALLEQYELANMNYQFLEDQDPEDIACTLAVEAMTSHSGLTTPSDLLIREFLVQQFDLEVVSDMLKQMIPENAFLVVSTSLLGVDEEYKANGYEGPSATEVLELKSKFGVRDHEIRYSDHFKAKFWVLDKKGMSVSHLIDSNPLKPEFASAIALMDIPAKNKFIPEDFNLKLPESFSHLLGTYVDVRPTNEGSFKGLISEYEYATNMITIQDISSPLKREVKIILADDDLSQLNNPDRGIAPNIFSFGNGHLEVLSYSNKPGPSPQVLAENIRTISDNDLEAGLIAKFAPLFSPILVESSLGNIQVQYQKDITYLTPKASAGISFILQRSAHSETVENLILSNLVLRVFEDMQNSDIYMAKTAEIDFNIEKKNYDVQMTFFGYNDKLFNYINLMIDRFFNFSSVLKDASSEHVQKAFIRALDSLKMKYQNVGLNSASLATDTRLQMFYPRNYTKEELLSGVAKLEGANVNVLHDFFEQIFLRTPIAFLGYAHGNFSSEDISSLVMQLEIINKQHNLSRLSFRDVNFPLFRLLKLEKSTCILRHVTCPRSEEKNNAVVVYLEIGKEEPKKKVLLEFIEHVMSEPIYNELRTKQQLGYSVSCSMRHNENILGYRLRVISSSHSCKVILQRLEGFLITFRAILLKLQSDLDHFAEDKEALTSLKLIEANNLKDQADLNWAECYMNTKDYFRWLEDAAYLQRITMDEVLEFYDHHFMPFITSKRASSGWIGSPTPTMRKRLIVCVHSVQEIVVEENYEVEYDGGKIVITPDGRVDGSFPEKHVTNVQNVREEMHAPASRQQFYEIMRFPVHGSHPYSKLFENERLIFNLVETRDIKQVAEFLSQISVHRHRAILNGKTPKPEGYTPLIIACRNGDLEMVKFLISKGADPTGERTENPSHYPLRAAALYGHIEVCRYLISLGVNVNQPSQGNRTPLMGAAMNNHIHVLKLLLDHGATDDLRNDFGETALELAKKKGNKHCIDLLLHI